MKERDNRLRPCLLISLCFALLFPLGFGAAEAKKDKASSRCEGTKKQRKQKMKKRDITEAQMEEMIARYKNTVLEGRERMKETVVRRLEREYEDFQATGEAFIYDILVISGGGAKGAFGAGFLEEWGKITSGPYARPDFDMVTGVSTGSLISPFAFIGSAQAYASVVDFYANPEPNWVRKRGMIVLLPDHISMFNDCHLQDTIRNAVDRSLVEALAKRAEEDRLLLIGATNLDIGLGRVFDLGQEAEQALQDGTFDRIHSILLASSAIPGVFPPIEIDEMLYADGGATSNLFIGAFPGPDGPVARFRAWHPEAPMPQVRVWILVNQQLRPHHAVTEPRWISISARALHTMTATSQLFALALIRDMVDAAEEERGIDAELHIVSIPHDAPKKTTKEMFDKEYMLKLEDLGRKMGADPSSWTTDIPSPYRVQSDWVESE